MIVGDELSALFLQTNRLIFPLQFFMKIWIAFLTIMNEIMRIGLSYGIVARKRWAVCFCLREGCDFSCAFSLTKRLSSESDRTME